MINFILRPNVKRAFSMIRLSGLNQTVRVFGGVKSALRSSHISLYIVENISGSCSEKGIVGDLISVQVGGCQLSLVVKHLFEMRYVPEGINSIPMETTADIILTPSLSHLAHGKKGHL